MNIGVYLASIAPSGGGGFTFQESILESLGKNVSKHEFFVFYYGPKKVSTKSNIHYIPLISPFNFIPYKLWWVVKNLYFVFLQKLFISKYNPLYKAVNDHRIDIVWFLTNNFEYVDIPFVFTVWDLQHRLQPFFPEVSREGWTWGYREDYYRSILPRATFVITGNESGKKEIMQFYGVDSDRIRLLPHPTPNFVFDEKIIPKKPEFVMPKAYVFYPAQYWPHKNHAMLFEAIKIVREKYHLDISLICSGSDKGNKKYLVSKIKQLSLTKCVTLCDFLTTEELVYLYKNAVALVYPTFFGPENLPPLEAFALKCPVIASDVSGAEEQLGDAAIRIDPTREDLWAQAIFNIHKDKTLRNQLIRKGFSRANSWTSDHFVRGITTLFDGFEVYRRCWK